jgi:hypothetical protein
LAFLCVGAAFSPSVPAAAFLSLLALFFAFFWLPFFFAAIASFSKLFFCGIGDGLASHRSQEISLKFCQFAQ